MRQKTPCLLPAATLSQQANVRLNPMLCCRYLHSGYFSEMNQFPILDFLSYLVFTFKQSSTPEQELLQTRGGVKLEFVQNLFEIHSIRFEKSAIRLIRKDKKMFEKFNKNQFEIRSI